MRKSQIDSGIRASDKIVDDTISARYGWILLGATFGACLATDIVCWLWRAL